MACMPGEAVALRKAEVAACRLYPALQDLRNRVVFVMTGDYVSNYLDYRPDLVNATMFIAEPYNSEASTAPAPTTVLAPLIGLD